MTQIVNRKYIIPQKLKLTCERKKIKSFRWENLCDIKGREGALKHASKSISYKGVDLTASKHLTTSK